MLTNHLFILGAQKCGTSSLASAIASSFTQVELSSPKEPMIFSRGDFECHRSLFCDFATPFFIRDDERLGQYAAAFKSAAPLKLDASTSYMISPEACASIKRCFPDARAVILLRDPVERMVSAYWHYLRSGVISHSFDRALEFGPLHLVSYGFYGRHLKDVFEVFGRDRVFVASDWHMYANTTEFSRQLEEFLGIRCGSEFRLGRENAGAYPFFFGLQLVVNYLRQRSNKNFYHRAVTLSRYETYGLIGGAAEVISRFNLRRQGRPRVRSLLVERLVELYKRENANIDDSIDFGDSSHWYGDYSKYFVTPKS